MESDSIRIGEVVALNPVACTCRVVFDDDDSLNSYDLPVMQRCTYDNHDYQMPDIGEDVVVAFRRVFWSKWSRIYLVTSEIRWGAMNAFSRSISQTCLSSISGSASIVLM